MKVSITFDKNLKQQKKKQWVKQIQSVIDRLNTKSVIETTPKISPNKNKKTHDDIVTSKQLSDKNNDSMILNQLICMQNGMNDNFNTLIGSITKLTDKVNQVQKRLNVLEYKAHNEDRQQLQFQANFENIITKYNKIHEIQKVQKGQKGQKIQKIQEIQKNQQKYKFKNIKLRQTATSVDSTDHHEHNDIELYAYL